MIKLLQKDERRKIHYDKEKSNFFSNVSEGNADEKEVEVTTPQLRCVYFEMSDQVLTAKI